METQTRHQTSSEPTRGNMVEQNPNQEELSELRKEIFIRQLMELTLSPGVTWGMPESFKFQTILVAGSDNYEVWLSRTPTGGKRDYQYTMDVKKNGDPFISTQEGESPLGERSTYVKWLYLQVERIILETEKNQTEANRMIVDFTNYCR